MKKRLIYIPILLLIFALARPQFGLKRIEIPSEGIDIVIALDASSSMDLVANNIKGESRLEQSKNVVVDFVQNFAGNRIGLIIFQSRTLILSPLTYDHNALRRQGRVAERSGRRVCVGRFLHYCVLQQAQHDQLELLSEKSLAPIRKETRDGDSCERQSDVDVGTCGREV